ncbi:response regulator [Falsigemmobacter intermedius]|uniref:Sensory/regulatory protein RpfC n=2 Tax=Falsigemmobacter intermedius TaxID=1553448 RepID=A0A3S3U3R0_9RHOB|nr:response regulator [Falsigemmobacter intermedius]
MHSAGFRKITLRMALAGILLLVILPTLLVVGMALRHAGLSFQEMSRQRLLETARILSSTSEGEISAIERLLLAKADLPSALRDIPASERGPGIAHYEMIRSAGGDWEITPEPLPEIAPILREAAEANDTAVSNIIEMPGDPDRLNLLLATPVPLAEPDENRRRVMLYQAHPRDLIRAFGRSTTNTSQVVLAITDGNGRLIGRSVGGDQMIGRPVPDWEKLKSFGTESGTFRAELLDGGGVVFAFQRIQDTPGWMAVTGEAQKGYDARWLTPIIYMISASTGAVVLGVVLALLLTRQILSPIRDLVERARRVTEGASDEERGSIQVKPSVILEFETLRESLDLAEEEMASRLRAARESEAQARDSNHSLREAERLARIGSWALDLQTGAFTASEMMSELNGRGPGAPPLPFEELENIVRPADFRRIREAIGRCIETGEPYAFEAVHFRADGSSFPVWLQGEARRDENGAIIGVQGAMQDISERAEQNARLAALADNLPRGAIFRIEVRNDYEVTVTYISGGIEDLIGRDPDQIIDHPDGLARAVHPDDRENIIAMLVADSPAGTQIDQQLRLVDQAGQPLWVRGRAALRIPVPGQKVWDGVILDISAERAAADALRQAKLAAETAERAKSDFLATMSHEIRTPMNSVVGMTRLALKTQLDPRQRTYLEKINSSANVLLGIINDILDFSRIEAGGLELEKAAFRMESVLETVASVNSLRAEEKGLELTFSVASDVPSALFGDSLRLGQVLTNLVGNAIKFTTEGDVEVSIRRLESTPEICKLEFSVRDTGIGLTEQQIGGLFRPFTQANTDTARIYGGTGLGLAICRRLVELMKGTIGVTSTPGQGSTFTFTAEFSAAPDAQVVAGVRRIGLPGLQGRRVLVVDDNDTARIALSEMIRGFGMVPDTASGGAEALDLLQTAGKKGQNYDIVLLDWRMPGMDGLELARLIRGDTALSKMPAILMVTAYGHQLALSEAGEIGLQGVLLKPVTQSVIFNTLMHALTREEEGPRELQQPDISDLGKFAERLAGRRVLVVDDNALNLEVASEFLSLVGVISETASNGREAIARLEQDRFDAVLMDVHMPVMNGLEAIREIRKRPEWQDLPVIALTAQASVEDEMASRSAGMNSHLTKPLDETLLYRTLTELLPTTEAAQAAPVSQEAALLPQDNRLADLSRRFGGSGRRLSRFLNGFLRDFSTMSEDYAEIEKTASLTEIADFAHRVKGVVGYVNATALYELSGQVELDARAGRTDAVKASSAELHRLMQVCVAEIRELIRLIPEEEAPAPPPEKSAETLLTDARSALPLVQSGDFAARGQLETLAAVLPEGELRQFALTALTEFDDLDLDAAALALSSLITALEATTGAVI